MSHCKLYTAGGTQERLDCSPALCACGCAPALSCPSPALVDVDVVDFVGADGDLGQGLDHVVALQDHVSLRGTRHTVKTHSNALFTDTHF